jgi:hypothetical protein
MRPCKELIAITVLIAIFVVAGLFLGGGEESHGNKQAGSDLFPDPSVLNDRGTGSKGLFEWTERIGYKPRTWRRSWDELSESGASVLFVIGPRFPDEPTSWSKVFGGGGEGEDSEDAEIDASTLRADDAETLMDWVRDGHTAVLMASRIGKTKAASGTGFGEAADLLIDDVPPTPALAVASNRRDFVPLQPVAATRGVLSIQRAGSPGSLSPPAGAGLPTMGGSTDKPTRITRAAGDSVALFGDAAGPFVLSIPAGRGRLIVVADTYFASNANLPRADNARFIANLLSDHARPGDRILFDELHHGDLSGLQAPSLWKAVGRPMQLALLQLIGAFMVVVGIVAIRFGSPIPLLQGVSRTSAEYVTSLAGLYRRARASTTALETLYRQFLRDLCGRLGISPSSSLEQVAVLAGRRLHTDPDQLRRLFARCEQCLDQGKVSEAELVGLTHLMETIRKEIGFV